MVNPQFSILAIPAIRGLALSLFLTTATAWTAPIGIGQFDFGSAVVAVDFLGMVPGVPVGGFYAALGVELGPGFYSDAPPPV